MIQPLPIAAEPIIEPPIPPVRKFNPVFIFAVLVLLSTVGVSGFLLGNSAGNSRNSAQPTVIPLPTEIPTPTPDLTANWKTYTNIKYGYSIKLPPDWGEWLTDWNVRPLEWKFTSTIDENSNELLLLGTDQILVKDSDGNIIEPWKIVIAIEKSKSDWFSGLQLKYTETVVTIGESISATKIDIPDVKDYGATYLIEKNNKLYRIAGEFTIIPELDQILSTFKFTSP